MYVPAKLTFCSILVSLVIAHQNEMPGLHDNGQPHAHQPVETTGHVPPRGDHFHEPGHRMDKNHVMEHLNGQIDKPVDKMDEAELQFHYFKLHDYDNNNKLDGIELISAMTDYHKDEEPSNAKVLTEAEITTMIDTILQEDDKNKDGYIDYPEYIASTKK